MAGPITDKCPRKLSAKQAKFVQMTAAGYNGSNAWKIAFGHPKANNQHAANQAYRTAKYPAVAAALAEIAERSRVETILTYNDRLELAAKDAQLPGSTPAAANARMTALKVYNDMAGDQPPTRTETTVKGGATAPIVAISIPVTKRDKLATFRSRRGASPGATNSTVANGSNGKNGGEAIAAPPRT